MYNQISGKNKLIMPQQTSKKPNLDTIKLTATTLILAEGTTTTLEVKNKLRSQGYTAYQEDISRQMHQIAEAEGWLAHDNGLFLIYTFTQLGLMPQ